MCKYYARFQSSTSPKEPEKSTKVSAGVLSLVSNKTASSLPKSQPARGCFHPGASALSRDAMPLEAGKPVTGTQMIGAMLQYIWPKDNAEIRDRYAKT